MSDSHDDVQERVEDRRPRIVCTECMLVSRLPIVCLSLMIISLLSLAALAFKAAFDSGK
jgi:hypothetical protein